MLNLDISKNWEHFGSFFNTLDTNQTNHFPYDILAAVNE